MNIKFCFPDR